MGGWVGRWVGGWLVVLGVCVTRPARRWSSLHSSFFLCRPFSSTPQLVTHHREGEGGCLSVDW